MNSIIEHHFDAVEVRIIQSPVIVSYRTLRREVSPIDGKLRVKAILINGGVLEIFAYVTESGGQISLSKYSFHWQTRDGKLQHRWDNAPHHLKLPGSPHHRHDGESIVQGVMNIPDIFSVIEKIENELQ